MLVRCSGTEYAQKYRQSIRLTRCRIVCLADFAVNLERNLRTSFKSVRATQRDWSISDWRAQVGCVCGCTTFDAIVAVHFQPRLSESLS